MLRRRCCCAGAATDVGQASACLVLICGWLTFKPDRLKPVLRETYDHCIGTFFGAVRSDRGGGGVYCGRDSQPASLPDRDLFYCWGGGLLRWRKDEAGVNGCPPEGGRYIRTNQK